MIDNISQAPLRSPDKYTGAKHIAKRYRELERDDADAAARGFNPESCYWATMDHSNQASDWTPVDGASELVVLRNILRLGFEDLARELPEHCEVYWRTWWMVRVMAIRVGELETEFSRQHVYRVLAKVDTRVIDATAWFDLLDDSVIVEEEMIAPGKGMVGGEAFESSRAVRVMRNPHAFDEEE